MKLPTLIQWAGTCRVCQCCRRLIDPIEFLKIANIFIQRENTITNIRCSEKVDVRTVLAGTYHSAGGADHADTTRSVASHAYCWWVFFASWIDLTLEPGHALSVVLENTTVLRSLVWGRASVSVDVILILLITIVVGRESRAVAIVVPGWWATVISEGTTGGVGTCCCRGCRGFPFLGRYCSCRFLGGPCSFLW